MELKEYKFAINFDLRTSREYEKELSKNVGISLGKMYNIIAKHLIKNGFQRV